MHVLARKLMVGSLLLAFVGQTALVYTDPTSANCCVLDDLALRGRAIWHRESCQTCHQIHGFGGFLGPDLTNAARRVDRARLDLMLTNGSQQMPAFHMPPEDIDAIEAYLEALDRTGIGQARAVRPIEPRDVLAMLDEHCRENPMTPDAERGQALFRARCTACHTPFRATPLGPFLAADLSLVAKRLDAKALDETLADGRPERGMPPTGCDPVERQQLIAFLGWLAEQEPVLRPRCDAACQDLGWPWFEYR